MYNCELFFVRGNNEFDKLNEQFKDIANELYQKEINVKYQTNISPDANKINEALSSYSDDDIEYYIFGNAITSKDNKSIKNLLFEFISQKQEELAETLQKDKDETKIRISSLGDFGNGYRGYCFRIENKKYIFLPSAGLCLKSNKYIFTEAIDRSNKVFDKLDAETDKDKSYLTTNKKKQGFFKSFFPQKNDSKKQKTTKIIVLVAILVVIAALAYLVDYFIIGPMMNTKVNSELQEIAYGTSDSSSKDKKSEQDWKALKKINDEIVGWIKIDDTKIDYPVLEHIGDDQNSQYYLYNTYKKEWSVYGSCFVDYRCTDSTKSKNVVIHGHHMNDGSMFSALMGYGDLNGNIDFYRSHPIITFNTPDGDAKWKIISVMKLNTLYDHGDFFNYMQGTFNSDAEFMNFVYHCRIRSLFDIPVMVNEDDQLLTLSTCSYEFSEFRTVVVARKVRENESTKVDTDLASNNSNTVYPDVYYWNKGGKKPKVYSFKVADKKGLIDWYDGKGNLKGDETLTATAAANPTEPTQAPTKKSKKNTQEPPKEDINFYTVNFLAYDGSVYETYSVQEGHSVPFPTNNPTMPSDDYYDYTFSHWQTDGMDLNNCHYGMDIAPYFEPKAKE